MHAKVNMENAQTMVADAKQQAQALQEAGLELLTETYAAEHDLDKEMVLRQLLWHEWMTMIFRKLGYHVSGKTYDPLKKLLIPDNPTNLDNTTLLDEIHELIVGNDLLICIFIDGALELDVVICLVVTFFMLIDTFNDAGVEMLSIFMLIHQEHLAN